MNPQSKHPAEKGLREKNGRWEYLHLNSVVGSSQLFTGPASSTAIEVPHGSFSQARNLNSSKPFICDAAARLWHTLPSIPLAPREHTL